MGVKTGQGAKKTGPGNRGRGSGDALAKGEEGGLGVAAEVQSGEDVPDVGAQGGLANCQPAGNLQDAASLGDEAEVLNFPADQ